MMKLDAQRLSPLRILDGRAQAVKGYCKAEGGNLGIGNWDLGFGIADLKDGMK